MPKLKTRKGLSKRIRVTRSGKLMRKHAWKSHMMEHKGSKRKQDFRQDQLVAPADTKAVRRALGV